MPKRPSPRLPIAKELDSSHSSKARRKPRLHLVNKICVCSWGFTRKIQGPLTYTRIQISNLIDQTLASVQPDAIPSTRAASMSSPWSLADSGCFENHEDRHCIRKYSPRKHCLALRSTNEVTERRNMQFSCIPR